MTDQEPELLGPNDVLMPEAVAGLGLPKKVDLVVHENGQRKVIGSAVVDTDGQHLDVTGVVTDPDYRVYIRHHSSISLSFGTDHDEASVSRRYRPHEALIVPDEPVEISARIPLDPENRRHQ